MKRNSSEKGQVVVMASLAITLVLAGLAVAVDIGWASYRREAAQAAADAAATAVVNAAQIAHANGHGDFTGTSNGLISYKETLTACPATNAYPPADSFGSGCLLAAQNGFTNAGTDTVKISATAGPCNGIQAAYCATAVVTEKALGFFGAATGKARLQPGATSSSALIGNSGCIYVLNPTAAHAFEASNNAYIISGCGVYVASNGSGASAASAACGGGANDAMYLCGGANLSTTGQAPIQVIGANLAGTDNSGSQYSPGTTTAAFPGDPYAGLAAPPVPPLSTGGDAGQTCQCNNFVKGGCTFTAGYCPNGLRVSNGLPLLLGAGLYYINGILDLEGGGGGVTTTGPVFFYITGDSTHPSGVIMANGDSGISLTAASTTNCGIGATQVPCAYAGLLFFQDRTITNPAPFHFAGGISGTLAGNLYFPHAQLDFDNGTNITVTGSIVADTVNFQGGNDSQIGTNPGSQITSYHTSVIQ
jgi:hypothetical protein